MIIFNTTYHIDDDVHDQCLLYFKNKYIAHATRSGALQHPRLAFIHPQHEGAGSNYCLQFGAKDMDTLNHWMINEGNHLQNEINLQFGNKVAAFVTLMDNIEL